MEVIVIVSVARGAAALAGPASLLSVVLFLVALAVHGDDVGAVARAPLGATSNALALVSVLLLLLGLVHLAATRSCLQDAGGARAVVLAGVGTTLLAGGAWSQLVVLPVLAVESPRLANEGAALLTAGYVASFLLTGLGWLLVALRLRGDAALSTGRVRLLLAGAVLMIAPLPTRWFVLALAVSMLAATGRSSVRGERPVPAAA